MVYVHLLLWTWKHNSSTAMLLVSVCNQAQEHWLLLVSLGEINRLVSELCSHFFIQPYSHLIFILFFSMIWNCSEIYIIHFPHYSDTRCAKGNSEKSLQRKELFKDHLRMTPSCPLTGCWASIYLVSITLAFVRAIFFSPLEVQRGKSFPFFFHSGYLGNRNPTPAQYSQLSTGRWKKENRLLPNCLCSRMENVNALIKRD